jgi:ATPase subunit of ABC transporter with duplicated ATPase domains
MSNGNDRVHKQQTDSTVLAELSFRMLSGRRPAPSSCNASASPYYEGNYQFYLEQRDLRQSQAMQRFAAGQRRVASAQRASDRRLALSHRMIRAPREERHGKDFYAAKASRVARTARLLRERAIHHPVAEKPWQEDPIPPLDFPKTGRLTGVALSAWGLTKSFEGKHLLLDELTNHLDIESREAVEDALLRFPGTVMFITHDRYFVEKLADEVLVLKKNS